MSSEPEVFVSYSSKDKAVADAAVAALESQGIACWYAPRDIGPGRDWGSAIGEAIERCKVFVLIFSGSANQSQHVVDELYLAISEEQIVVPFRIENLDPTGAMKLPLVSRHWLDAFRPTWRPHLDALVGSVADSLGRDLEQRPAEPDEPAPASGATRIPRWAWGTLAGLLAIAVVSAAVVWAVGGSDDSGETTTSAPVAASTSEVATTTTEATTTTSTTASTTTTIEESTTTAPTTTVAPPTGPGPCPDATPVTVPEGSEEYSSVQVDMDGDGYDDLFAIYVDASGTWYESVEFYNGFSTSRELGTEMTALALGFMGTGTPDAGDLALVGIRMDTAVEPMRSVGFRYFEDCALHTVTDDDASLTLVTGDSEMDHWRAGIDCSDGFFFYREAFLEAYLDDGTPYWGVSATRYTWEPEDRMFQVGTTFGMPGCCNSPAQNDLIFGFPPTACPDED